MSRSLLMATSNAGKAAEFRRLLGPFSEICLDLGDFPGFDMPPERGNSFVENARDKALSAAAFAGRPALADDSGLEVDALGGRPGVRSARFAGPEAGDQERNDKLLEALRDVDDPQRGATFVCALALAEPGPKDGMAVRIIEARCRGRIVRTPRGERGFGYDPLFLHPPTGKTFAQLGEGKHAVSHRGLAFSMLLVHLKSRWA